MNVEKVKELPALTLLAGQAALRAMLGQKGMLQALLAIQRQAGPIFRISLPGFQPVVFCGPEANRFVLVEERSSLLWRNEPDPVTRLLRHGLLVEDGDSHRQLRLGLSEDFQRIKISSYVPKMAYQTSRILDQWRNGQVVDMLVEMRKVALLILMDCLFGVDMLPDLERLWKPILRLLRYISPGAWLAWRGFQPRYPEQAAGQIDEYLYGLIASRRSAAHPPDDLLTRLVFDSGLDDDWIRDQLLTLLIAGHDTSTALMAWVLYLLGSNREALQRAYREVDRVVGVAEIQHENLSGFTYLEQVLDETLRMYPPIHTGNRQTACELYYDGYRIPAGQRVIYSIYLTQHDEKYWPEPEVFRPERFAAGFRPEPYTYIPFGGGPRNCIGAGFARVEGKVILAKVLQQFELRLVNKKVREHMGATLEPRPGVMVEVRRRD